MRPRRFTRLRLLIVATITYGLAIMGCGKGSETTASPSVGVSDPAATLAPSSRSAPSASPATSASPAPAASVPRAAPAPVPSAASSTPPAVAHPLDTWMRGTASPAFLSGDLGTIAATFDQMVRWAPPGYVNWGSIARDGADAARVGNLDATKAACRECHAQYEQSYHAQFAERPLP